MPAPMHNLKEDVVADAVESDVPYSDSVDSIITKHGTTADRQDMLRMGKRQETQRNFRHITIFAFVTVILAIWENILSTAVFALGNGGTAGLIWGYLLVMVGFGFVTASLAEMASMAPTSGGQYHWVSEFAPRNCQKLASYMCGWLGVLGWQTGAAFTSFLTTKQVQALIIMWNMDTYTPAPWHFTLINLAVLAISVLFNVFASKHLPLIEGAVVVLHIAGFFAVLIPLWVMGDESSFQTQDIFTVFQDNMAWGSIPLSTMVGLTGVAGCFVGVEAGVHMSEEVRDASHVIPRSMMWTWLGNGVMGWIMAITFSFRVGDTMSVLETPLGAQQVQVFLNTTKSRAGTTGLTIITLVIGVFACVAVIATNSRQLFAFARDKGIPFSSTFAQVSSTWEVPLNAVYVTTTFVFIMSLINLGSTVAFSQILSLGVSAMLSTYAIAIFFVALKRIRGEPMLPSKFNLGKWGLTVNMISLIFLFFLFIFAFFPTAPSPTPASMNWAVMTYGTVVIFAFGHYVFRSRHVYVGPVEYVRKQQ